MQQAFHVSGSSLTECNESGADLDEDPRGVVWMYEEPKSWATYIMGCDPTVGITGWSRASRTDGDHKTDNGVIEIFRVDAIPAVVLGPDRKPEIDPRTKHPRMYYKDLQVAEFAAPCDAVEIARVCNLLGRIYAGSAVDQCELIHEAFPGPGMLTTQELLRLGYSNLWYWEYIDSVVEETSRVGWRSSRETQKLLWYRSRRHLIGRNAIIQSKHLLAEYSNAVIDVDKMRAMAAYGYHDDRMQAANMCFWAGHKWTYDVERTSEPVTATPDIDWQRSAPVLGDETGSLRDRWSTFFDD